MLLDLQRVLNEVYDRGGYDILDYHHPPKPPLTADLAQWVGQCLRQQGLPTGNG